MLTGSQFLDAHVTTDDLWVMSCVPALRCGRRVSNALVKGGQCSDLSRAVRPDLDGFTAFRSQIRSLATTSARVRRTLSASYGSNTSSGLPPCAGASVK